MSDGMIKSRIGAMRELKQFLIQICMSSAGQESLDILQSLKEKNSVLIGKLEIITGLCLFGLF